MKGYKMLSKINELQNLKRENDVIALAAGVVFAVLTVAFFI